MSTFILSGCWTGEPFTPDRLFEGTVVQPGDSGMQPGDPVTVTFDAGRHVLLHDASQRHGGYRLGGMPSERFVLVGFVRKDGGTNHEAEASEDAQLWGGDLFRS